MDDRILTEEIIGKKVETAGGQTIGTLSDIVLDCEDGSIKYLLVKTVGSVIENAHRIDEEGRLVVSTKRMRLETGKIVIN